MAKEKWTSSVAALQQWMKEAGMDLLLITLLISQLQAWYNNAPLSTNTIPLIDQQQSVIGWDRLVDGWLSKAWQEHQEQYWGLGRTRRSSKWWTTELIKKLWNVAWDMWEQRNGVLHAESETSQFIRDSKINEEIRHIYLSGFQALPRDAFAFL